MILSCCKIKLYSKNPSLMAHFLVNVFEGELKEFKDDSSYGIFCFGINIEISYMQESQLFEITNNFDDKRELHDFAKKLIFLNYKDQNFSNLRIELKDSIGNIINIDDINSLREILVKDPDNRSWIFS